MAVPMEATYDTSADRMWWEDIAQSVSSSGLKTKVPSAFTTWLCFLRDYRALLALAAVAAPNPVQAALLL